MNNLGEMILNHYEKYLGEFIGAETYVDDKYQIQLLGFDKAVENCLLFATFGLSKITETLDECCEIIMASDDDYDSCAEIFMNSIFYVLSNNLKFRKGLLIEGADAIVTDFSCKHNKSALYFTEQYIFPDKFTSIEDKCKIYMCFFITEKEAQYIKQYGCEIFEDLLEQKNIDVIDIKRASII